MDLDYFVIFDITPPKEGEEPKIYFFYTPNNSNTSHSQQMIYTGILITFLSFSQRFHPDSPCDYISTSTREIGIYCLTGTIFMGVSIFSTKNSNRSIIKAALQQCRTLFSHFFIPLPPLPSSSSNLQNFFQNNPWTLSPDNFTQEPKQLCSKEEFLNLITKGFDFIVPAIQWKTLEFSYLYDSRVVQPVLNSSTSLKEACLSMMYHPSNSHLSIDGIAVFAKKSRVVYSSFPAITTKALAFGLKKRFRYLYQHNPINEGDTFMWLIGLYRESTGRIAIFQPPIFFDGKKHLILAFIFKSYKIVLTQNIKETEVDENLLLEISRSLKPVRLALAPIPISTPIFEAPFLFAISINHPVGKYLVEDMRHVDVASRPIVNDSILFVIQCANRYGRDYNGEEIKGMVVMPTSPFLFSACLQENDDPYDPKELVVVMEKKEEGVTKWIDLAHRLECSVITHRDETISPQCYLL